MTDTSRTATGAPAATVTEIEKTVDAYLTRSYDADRRRALIGRQGWDPAFLGELDELGWFALAVPDEHGGLGLPLSATGAAMLSAGRHLVPGPLPERLLLPALLLRHLGSAHPGPDLTGALVALVDPAALGSWAADDAGLRAGPDGPIGGMLPVRFAAEADLLLTVARSADGNGNGNGTVVHLLPADAPGIAVQPVRSADPTARLARVTLTRTGRPGPAPVLTGPAADRFATELRAWARILAACELSGMATRLVEDTTAFVLVRKQFGRPIGSFQAVKHLLADLHTLASSLRNLCDVTLADAAGGSTDTTAGQARSAAVAKAYAADVAVRVAEGAIQLHGGTGFTTETDLHLYYKRALALRAGFGDPEELAHEIGDDLLGGAGGAP